MYRRFLTGGRFGNRDKRFCLCEESHKLFFVGFNAVSDWTNVIQIYEDIAKNINDAHAAV